MNSKKLLSLLAVSVLTLSACGSGDDNKADDKDKDDDVSALLDEAEEESDGSAMPEYGLTITDGAWTTDGYIVEGPETAVIPGAVLTEHDDFHVYLVDSEGQIVDETDEPEFAFEVDVPAEGETLEYLVGVAKGELDGEVSEDDFERSENIIVQKGEAAEEEE